MVLRKCHDASQGMMMTRNFWTKLTMLILFNKMIPSTIFWRNKIIWWKQLRPFKATNFCFVNNFYPIMNEKIQMLSKFFLWWKSFTCLCVFKKNCRNKVTNLYVPGIGSWLLLNDGVRKVEVYLLTLIPLLLLVSFFWFFFNSCIKRSYVLLWDSYQ